MDVVIALHSHLPFVLHHGRWPHGSDWLSEAAVDTYLPLLETLNELAVEDVPAPMTLGITPVLANQLAHPSFRTEVTAFLTQRLAACDEAPSLIAECFRATLTSILFAGGADNRPRVLVVTSASPGEGKTTVASNLAIALAEINRRVLLIDADMRKPRLHKVFGVSNLSGLSNLLRERNPLNGTPLAGVAQATGIPDLFVLSSGPGAVSIPNLLHSERMAELLEKARGEFDTILIDSPPMLPIADARILARSADAVVLVLQAGRTSRDSARAVVNRTAIVAGLLRWPT
jgi:capsular exopolysaccharide synthesis family protein